MSSVLQDLTDQMLIDTDIKQMLSTKYDNLKLSFFLNEEENNDKMPKKRTYSDEIMSFAQTLNFLSPKAYKYVRKHFCLPDRSTLRRRQTVNGEPGWTAESFVALKDDPSRNDCIVIFDAVHLKEQVDWIKSSHGTRKSIGYVDIGSGNYEDTGELAKEALVFLAVGCLKSWKLPLGYFLNSGPLKAIQQKELVTECIERLHECGVRVRCITCDGTSANISTLELLGASIPNIPWFEKYGSRIYTCLDVAHMIKLARNCIATTPFTSPNGKISWSYFQALFDIQSNEGLRLANKITAAHIKEWHKRKMKVSLATQTLSASVADAMEFLKEIGNPNFLEAEATIQFIRLLNE